MSYSDFERPTPWASRQSVYPVRHGRRPGLPLALATLLLAGFVPAGAQDPATAPGSPRIVVEVSEIDMGRLIRGDVGTATFHVRNDGSETLHIRQVKPG